jgi:hypothetical protein
MALYACAAVMAAKRMPVVIRYGFIEGPLGDMCVAAAERFALERRAEEVL